MKVIVFFLVGAIFYFLSDVAMGQISSERLRTLLGIDLYRILYRIIYILFGLAFFVVMNKVVRKKSFQEIFVFGIPKPLEVLNKVLAGILIPVILLGAVFLLLLTVGNVEVLGLSDTMSILGFISIGFNVATTAIFEELAFRSYVFKILYERYGIFIGCLVTSVMFSLIHVASGLSIIGFVNLFLLSVVFTTINLQAKSIFPSIFAHFSWNFMHSVILSLRMYGGIYYPHVFDLNVTEPKILSGSDMGLEESVITTVLLLIVTIYSYKRLKEISKDVKSKQL